MTLVFFLLGLVVGCLIAQKLWDIDRLRALAVFFMVFGVPLCGAGMLAIAAYLGLVSSGDGTSFGCYSEEPYGVKCD